MTAAPLAPPGYRTLSLRRLRRFAAPHTRWLMLGAWVLLAAACMAVGLLTFSWHLATTPLSIGGFQFYLMIYPPQIVAMLLTLCLGWWWGAIPAYLSTFALAVYADMPWPWASLFACADPLGLAILIIGYRAIPVRRDRGRWIPMLFYVQLSFIAAVFSSVGALVWSYLNHLDRSSVLALWQAWWLGLFVQSLAVVSPLLALASPMVQRWQQRNPRLFVDTTSYARRHALLLLAIVTAGVLLYCFAAVLLSSHQISLALSGDMATLARMLDDARQTLWVFFWVFVAVILFLALMGYQLYWHWQNSNDILLGQLRQANDTLEHLARTDSLTGLLNRRAIDERLLIEFQRFQRTGHAAALLLLDIDHFKQINDRHGHLGGDIVIRNLAKLIRETVRTIDMTARYGGEEFLVMLPETDTAGALSLAERLHQSVAEEAIEHEGHDIVFRISIGVAGLHKADASYYDWLGRADRALYAAKENGRNCTVLDELRVPSTPSAPWQAMAEE